MAKLLFWRSQMSIVIVLTLGKITQILENHGSRPVATKENTTHQEKKKQTITHFLEKSETVHESRK